MSKRALLLSAVIAAGAGTALYFNVRRDQAEENKPQVMKPASASAASAATPSFANNLLISSDATITDVNRLAYNTKSFKAAPLPERLSVMSARRRGRAFNPEAVANALQSDDAWVADSSGIDRLTLSKQEQKDGREFIRMNPLTIEALMPGDELNLPITQAKHDGPLRMVVDRVEDGGEGNLTWHGHLKDFSTENQVSFTRGDTLIVGGVNIPDKNFVVQIHDDVGWIADGFTLFKGRHDAIKPDRDTEILLHSH